MSQTTLSIELFRRVLEVDKEYKYKKMCVLLGQKYYTGGKAKILQIKEWERYVVLENIGTKYKVISINTEVAEKIDKRGKSKGSRRNNNPHGDKFDMLIKSSSCVTGGAVANSYGKLLTEDISLYKPILTELYEDKSVNDLSVKLGIDASMINEYVTNVKYYVKEQVKKSLNRLQEENVLTYETYYSIKPVYSEAIMLSSKDSQIIIDVETEVCKEMGYKNRSGKTIIYKNKAKSVEFSKRVLERLNANKVIKSYSTTEIINYWECVSYEFSDSYTEEFTEQEYKEALINTTHAIIETMHYKFDKATKNEENRIGFGAKEDKYIKVAKYDTVRDRSNIIKLDSTFFTQWTSDWIDTKNAKYTKLMIRTNANTKRAIETILDISNEATVDVLFTQEELNTIPFLTC